MRRFKPRTYQGNVWEDSNTPAPGELAVSEDRRGTFEPEANLRGKAQAEALAYLANHPEDRDVIEKALHMHYGVELAEVTF